MKTKLTFTTIALAVVAAGMMLFTAYLPAQAQSSKPPVDSTASIEMIADGLRSFNEGGLYRVIDTKTGNIVYVLTTGRSDGNLQMAVVPRGLSGE